MITFRPFFTAFILSLSASPIGYAQTVPPATPTPPSPKIILTPAADKVAWTIRYTYGKSREAVMEEKKGDLAEKTIALDDLARPEKVSFIIKNPVSSAVTNYEDGAKDEAYYYANFEFKKNRRQKDVFVTNLDNYPTVEQLFRKRFPGVHWVNPKLFVKVEEAYGESCAYFREGAAPLPKDTEKMDIVLDASKYGVREAWFSMATGLPIAFKNESATGRFTFETPPTEALTIPMDIRESISKQAKYLAYLEARAAQMEPQPGQAAKTPKKTN